MRRRRQRARSAAALSTRAALPPPRAARRTPPPPSRTGLGHCLRVSGRPTTTTTAWLTATTTMSCASVRAWCASARRPATRWATYASASVTSSAARTGAAHSSAGSWPSASAHCSCYLRARPARPSGYTDTSDLSGGDAETIGLVGGALLLAALMIAYFAGGYVAGRMSRFDGARQGFADVARGHPRDAPARCCRRTCSAGVQRVPGSRPAAHPGRRRRPDDCGGLIALAARSCWARCSRRSREARSGERYHVRVDRFGFERDPDRI